MSYAASSIKCILDSMTSYIVKSESVISAEGVIIMFIDSFPSFCNFGGISLNICVR